VFFPHFTAFLKSHGALLNAVKPEMLLDHEDFGRWGQATSEHHLFWLKQ
jgi:hypothetical protein